MKPERLLLTLLLAFVYAPVESDGQPNGPPPPHVDPFKRFHFDRRFAGDCVMDDTNVVASFSGGLHFEGVSFSHHPSLFNGDTWHAMVSLLDKDQVVLYSTEWSSPKMEAAESRVRWGGNAKFDHNLFRSIAFVEISDSC